MESARFFTFILLVLCVKVQADFQTSLPAYSEDPSYSYVYSISNSAAHNFMTHHETFNGEGIGASYSLAEPDRSGYVFGYNADPSAGYNGVVYRGSTPSTISPLNYGFSATPTTFRQPVQLVSNIGQGYPIVDSPQFATQLKSSGSNIYNQYALRMSSSFDEKKEVPFGYVPLVAKINTPPGYKVHEMIEE